MRQPVRAPVQFAIAQAVAFERDRHRVRAFPHLRFEQGVDAGVAWIIGIRRVEGHQQLMALGVAQQRQCADTLRRIGHQCPQQELEMARQALDARTVEQIGRVLQHTA
ncbi:hypothetical protein QSH18_21790 [Xanthomonas sp. NCPPB 2654]|uniref:hypothetical protein n=1 Tax=Xanthomonas sp. NCPPB 2654 TaxID=487541 RepID=UPI00256F16D6|nr:hypothetical protein [Xanthomonas sp. NCPPB 2654]MDL5368243.1 hypothetical protein [Xanthomonas sp. NCPPB 2654]